MILPFEQWLRQSHGSIPDLCIVGAGPAGLEIARQFATGRRRVLVLEAGVSHVDPALQKFCRVIECGTPRVLPDNASPFWAPGFPEEQTFVRAFGGVASIGAGRWKAPDPIDFQDREWIPSTGWPIQWTEIAPFAIDVLQTYRIPHARMMPDQVRDVQSLCVTPHFVEKAPTNFGREIRDALDASQSVTVLLRANAVELFPIPGGAGVESVIVVDQNGERHRIAASQFVVAVGAVETARLLLNSTRFGGQGPGNRRGFVGANFIDHATRRVGSFHPLRGAASTGILGNTGKNIHGLQSRITLSATLQRDLGIANHALEFKADPTAKKGMMQQQKHDVHLVVEQTPGSQSRITVDPEKDLNGVRLASVSWGMSEEDVDGVKKFLAEINKRLDPEYGTLELEEETLTAEGWRACGHHMGTTRMAGIAADGVVDANCRVFGTENLFIAGGSVFPVGGNADPVLLLLALARRLAKHLQG